MNGEMWMAIVEDQLVEVKWNGSNKAWYESKGYEFTKLRDHFLVKLEHSPNYSSTKIELYCDYCGEKIMRSITSWNISKKNFS
jgi:hypothetical protein